MNVGGYFRRQMQKDLNRINPQVEKYAAYSRNSVEYWQSNLGLSDWLVLCIPISEMQVVDDMAGGTPGHEFVGVCTDVENQIARIYHTRALYEDDIVHELLHVRFQDWDESQVVHWTNKLVNSTEPISLLSELMLIVA